MGFSLGFPSIAEVSLPPTDAMLFAALLVLTHIVPIGDAIDMCIRFYLKRLHTAGSAVSPCPRSIDLRLDDDRSGTPPVVRPYAIIASVHNVEGQIDAFLTGLGQHREHLWVVDDASDDRTLQYLHRERVHAIRISKNSKKPAALRALLAELPSEIATVLVVDPDITLEGVHGTNLESVVGSFQRSGHAAACPRLIVEEDGVLSYLQALEYDLAMLVGRASLGDFSITSGIALYRRDALETTLDAHSLSVYAEDLENTFLLLSRGEKIYFDGSLVVRTHCPSTWGRWFSQRVGWSYGLVRAYALHWRRLWEVRGKAAFLYQYFVYLGLLSIAMQPLRIAALLVLFVSAANAVDGLIGLELIPNSTWTSPYYFVLAYTQYLALSFAVLAAAMDARARARHARILPLYFFYVLVQVVPVSIGFLNWISMRYFDRRVYRDHYSDALGRAAVPVDTAETPA